MFLLANPSDSKSAHVWHQLRKVMSVPNPTGSKLVYLPAPGNIFPTLNPQQVPGKQGSRLVVKQPPIGNLIWFEPRACCR